MCWSQNILGQMVIDRVPSVEMVRFVNSGTEACLSVLRLMRAFTGREKVHFFKSYCPCCCDQPSCLNCRFKTCGMQPTQLCRLSSLLGATMAMQILFSCRRARVLQPWGCLTARVYQRDQQVLIKVFSSCLGSGLLVEIACDGNVLFFSWDALRDIQRH